MEGGDKMLEKEWRDERRGEGVGINGRVVERGIGGRWGGRYWQRTWGEREGGRVELHYRALQQDTSQDISEFFQKSDPVHGHPVQRIHTAHSLHQSRMRRPPINNPPLDRILRIILSNVPP